MGAYEAASISLLYIQDGLVDFLNEFSSVSNDDSTVKLFFWTYSINHGLFACYAFLHAALLSMAGYMDAMIIYKWLEKLDSDNGMDAMTAE